MLSEENPIRRDLIAVLLIVAVLVATMGMVCHHHRGGSTDQCVLCHLVIAPVTPAVNLCGLASAPADYILNFERLFPHYTSNRTTPRAPPV